MRISRREALCLAALPVAGAVGWSVRRFAQSRMDESHADLTGPIPDAENAERLQRIASALKPLFAPLPAPAPDEWLAKHSELGQTFLQFVSSYTQKQSSRHRKLCIAPLGDLSELQLKLCDDAGDFLERFFGFPVDRLEPVPLDDLPDEAQRVRESGTRQVLTRYLLNKVLAPLCEDETAAVFGLTAHDLWDGDFSFLFGQGLAGARVCVGSLARLGDLEAGDVDYATCLRRTVGLAVHETGHVFGLSHCTAYSCRMNGSNHLAEAERRPLEFCPECLPKIWWTCDVDPASRFARLIEFGEEHKLTNDTKLWRSARDLLQTRANVH